MHLKADKLFQWLHAVSLKCLLRRVCEILQTSFAKQLAIAAAQQLSEGFGKHAHLSVAQLEWWQHRVSGNTRFDIASVLCWQVVEQQMPALKQQVMELAVTGAAFTLLQQSEAMEQLLFYTRIFARFAPAQKVRTRQGWFFSVYKTA